MGETKLLSVPRLRREIEQVAAEAAEAGVPGTAAMLPGEALALVEAVEAARVLAESGELDPHEDVKRDVLRDVLDRFDFGDGA